MLWSSAQVYLSWIKSIMQNQTHFYSLMGKGYSTDSPLAWCWWQLFNHNQIELPGKKPKHNSVSWIWDRLEQQSLALKKRVNTKASKDSRQWSCWRMIPQHHLASEQSEVAFPIKYGGNKTLFCIVIRLENLVNCATWAWREDLSTWREWSNAAIRCLISRLDNGAASMYDCKLAGAGGLIDGGDTMFLLLASQWFG